MPRKITIFLSAPPGDGLRAAREHFIEYIKPVLVAGALDWEVVEGRREGDVRAGLAEKIRKLRIKAGEPSVDEWEPDQKEIEQDAIIEHRKRINVEESPGLKGDLIIGRHTWKEYVRGLHEGWLGPVDAPSVPETTPTETPSELSLEITPPAETSSDQLLDPNSSQSPSLVLDPKPAPKPSGPRSAYIDPSAYPTAHISPKFPSSISPSLALPFPHLLSFLNTPYRIHRFLTRRYLADDIGRSVAALVLATHTRPYHSNSISGPYPQSPDTDSSSDSPTAQGYSIDDRPGMFGRDGIRFSPVNTNWEQQTLLQAEEGDWHKSAWKESPAGEPPKERVWADPVVIDERIGQRMSTFELGAEDEARSREPVPNKGKNWLEEGKRWIGMGEKERRGWNMGLEGEQGD